VRGEVESPTWRATSVRGEAESPTWRATSVRKEAESPNPKAQYERSTREDYVISLIKSHRLFYKNKNHHKNHYKKSILH